MASKQTKKTAAAPARSKKSTSKKPGAKASAATPRDVAKLRRRNQILGWVLLGIALLLLANLIFPFQSVWYFVHTVQLGLFGYLGVLLPVLLGYVAILIATGQSATPRTTSRTVFIFVIMGIVCAVFYAFQYGDSQTGQPFFDNLGELYGNGTLWQSPGLVSGLVGIPFVLLCGAGGAKILTVVLLLVCILILTGITMLQIRDAFKRQTQRVASGVSGMKEAAVERRQVRREEKQKKQAAPSPNRPNRTAEELADIPLAGETPETRVQAAARRTKEKQAQLYRVLNLEDHTDPASPQTPTEETVAPSEPLLSESEASLLSGMEAKEKEPSPKQRGGEKPELVFSEDDNGAAAAATAFVEKMQKSQAQELQAAVEAADLLKQSQKATYHFPPVQLLEAGQAANQNDVTIELQEKGQKLVEVLASFGVQTRILDISRGPAVTRFELQPAAGVKISKITNLSDDIAMNLAASVRIEAPIPGKAAVGVEVPNHHVSVVKMRELVESAPFQKAKSKLTVALGRDISGQIVLADLAKMPHVLIAGATGSGKSVCINSLIISLLYKASPEEVKLLMVDPKVVELGIYNGIPHLLVPVVTDPRKAAGALGWAVTEMLNRYKTFADNNVRDLKGYNTMVGKGILREDGVRLEPMPQIVIIIDELADLMMAAPKDVEDSICRLAQMARAAGMHLVIATQRPSVDVITGIIKANIPSRIAFAVSSQVDSRTILDGSGAEKLLGRGDMLFAPSGSPKPMRVQGCFVEDWEVEHVVSYVKQKQDCDYDASVLEEIERNAAGSKTGKEEEPESSFGSSDPMMPEAIQCVVEAGQASTSLLQRRLRLGYARAGRLIDEMEQMGIVGPHEGSKPRQVLLTYQDWLELRMQQNDQANDQAAEKPAEVPADPAEQT